MKQLFGFVVLYASLGVVTWVVIDAEHRHSTSPLDAYAAPVALRSQLSDPLQPVSLPSATAGPAAPAVSKPAASTLGPSKHALANHGLANHGPNYMGNDLRSEFRCLALNIYWEARSESSTGQFAVAAVTLNRVAHKRFPGTICGVVRQGGSKRKNQCQFSWWCDGKSDVPTNKAAWQAAKSIAYTALFFGPPDPTDGALWYHADYVKPSWTSAMSKTATIGRHIYYRKPMQARRETIASDS